MSDIQRQPRITRPTVKLIVWRSELHPGLAFGHQAELSISGLVRGGNFVGSTTPTAVDSTWRLWQWLASLNSTLISTVNLQYHTIVSNDVVTDAVSVMTTKNVNIIEATLMPGPINLSLLSKYYFPINYPAYRYSRISTAPKSTFHLASKWHNLQAVQGRRGGGEWNSVKDVFDAPLCMIRRLGRGLVATCTAVSALLDSPLVFHIQHEYGMYRTCKLH
jgi:hypothetical protein